ncbi:hypothetical protein QBC37DRAFT_483867 [Rhypophila decipiens]|uniref:Uncharacterized protein n=1 Tax=Rhypophila decipiens TaxID=261697 RepID=A0AAN7B8X9_9PEZI|nr:hypothetical protein QBC37DRAFT_483867 [Rhypophila decipiens]
MGEDTTSNLLRRKAPLVFVVVSLSRTLALKEKKHPKSETIFGSQHKALSSNQEGTMSSNRQPPPPSGGGKNTQTRPRNRTQPTMEVNINNSWLRDQAEQIAKNLDESLKEPPEDKLLRRLGLGIFCLPVGTTLPVQNDDASSSAARTGARLCSAHRGLRRDVVASLFGQLRGLWVGGSWERLCWQATTTAAVAVASPSCGLEVDNLNLGNVNHFGSAENKRRTGEGARLGRRNVITTGGLEEQAIIARAAVEDFIKVIIEVSALTMPERDLRQRFGPCLDSQLANGSTSWTAVRDGAESEGEEEKEQSRMFAGPDDKRLRYIASGCEACVLATIGRGGTADLKDRKGKDSNSNNHILAVLRAALLARAKSTIQQGQPLTAVEDKKPGLLRLVEAWIALDEKEQDVSKASDDLKKMPSDGRVKNEVEKDGQSDSAREQRRRNLRRRAREVQYLGQQGQPRWRKEKQEQYCPGEEERGDNEHGGGSLSLAASSRQQPQQQPTQEYRRERPQKHRTVENQEADNSQGAQESESSPQKQPQERAQQQQQRQQDHGNGEDKSDSTPTTIPFTGAARTQNDERLPKVVYAHILPLSTAPHNQQLHRRTGKEDLRADFRGGE